METNENLTEKLNFIGLDLENIPDRLNYFHSINFGLHKNYVEKNYKVYKYLNVDDIDIFLTPTDRFTDYTEKYAKALPIAAYLGTSTDEEMAKNIEFLKMVKDLQLDEVKEIEETQKEYRKHIPYNIQYTKDFLWQIYYSDSSKRFFMLAPIMETDRSAMFYVLKKQLENTNEKIYVPICYADYSGKYLTDDEIDELNKYMCFFAKDWPMVFETYDIDNNISLNILGKANIFDTIKSEYKIELKDQGEAENFYKLVKALFILETQLSHYYTFKVKIDKNGYMHFYLKDREIDYDELISFVKEEYVQGIELIIKAKETKINLEKQLKSLKTYCSDLDKDYHEKEKQIATFLECKKTFFGRVRYFLKYKKKTIQNDDTKQIGKEEIGKFKYCERTEIKDSYTIEELLELYSNLDKESNEIKDLEAEVEAMNKRIDIIQTKIKNANQFIKEIDEHKKSIFEFWKFTNKDNEKQLNGGTVDVPTSKKLKKSFNYEIDFEDVSKRMDKEQRELLNKDETDNIFLATTEIIEDINLVANNNEIPVDHLERLKSSIKDSDTVVTFDIFGSADSTREQIKLLGNIRHRESKKNKFAILDLKEDTTMDNYKKRLEQAYKSIKNSEEKIKSFIDIPIYKIGKIDDGLNVFYINPDNALEQVEGKETDLIKMVLKEETNYIAFTNIMYYNNTNQTLPLRYACN